MAPGDSDRPPSAVLFACGMNSVRSPMAAAITRHLFPHSIYVASAGVREGKRDPFVTVVMDEIGIDLSEHRPHTFEDLSDSSFDLIVSLAPDAHHQALEMTRTMAVDAEYWPTEDPTFAEGSRDQRLNAYRRTRDLLVQRIKKRFGWQRPPSG